VTVSTRERDSGFSTGLQAVSNGISTELNRMKSRTLQILFTGMMMSTLLFSAVILTAGTIDVEPDSWDQETMGGPEVIYGEGGLVTVSFTEQSTNLPPQFRTVLLMANASVSEGAFVGDYLEEGIKAVYLKTANSQPPCSVTLVLQGAESGRIWRNTTIVQAVSNEWVENTISLDRSSGWTRDGGGDLDSMWTQDLHNVAMIGVRVTQAGFEAQTCSIDQFMLKDASGFATGPAELTDLQQALLERFGVADMESLTAEQLAADADEDGMTDVNELIAGTNPDLATSLFTAEIVENLEGEGITISWPCVKGSKYTVMRSTNLIAGMQNLAVGLVAGETGTMTYHDDTATGSGAYFYRIRKD